MSQTPILLADAIAAFLSQENVTDEARVMLSDIARDGEGGAQPRGVRRARAKQASAATMRVLAAFTLSYISSALRDHRLSQDELQRIRRLKHVLFLGDGALLRLQRGKIVGLMRSELGAIIADGLEDTDEAVHQVDLQGALGLGYDEYLGLAREFAAPLLGSLRAKLGGNAPIGADERREAEEHIRFLQTVFPSFNDEAERR